MTNNSNNQSGRGERGGTHEQHVKAGEQSHKNSGNQASSGGLSSGSQGGSHEQHMKAGEQSHKNSGTQSDSGKKR